MTESKDNRPFEEKLADVSGWVQKIAEIGVVEEIDPMLVKSVLEGLGANFEISEEKRASLHQFTNLKRRPGIDAVWSSPKVKEYRIWLKHWVEDYEKKTSKPLPVIEGTHTKTSGGFKFFTDLTVFAAGLMSFEEYKKITERRAEKGRLWQTRKEGEPIIPTDYSSFPPEFPIDAWEHIKGLQKV